MMKLPSIILFLSFATLNLTAQSKWGYSVASLKVKSHDEFFEIVFISKVKRLSSLPCQEDSATNALATDDRYSKCICDWFYERIGQVNPKAYELLDRTGMMGDIELFGNPPQRLRERLKWNELQMAEFPTIYLNKKNALKKRDEFLALAKQTNGFVVEID